MSQGVIKCINDLACLLRESEDEPGSSVSCYPAVLPSLPYSIGKSGVFVHVGLRLLFSFRGAGTRRTNCQKQMRRKTCLRK